MTGPVRPCLCLCIPAPAPLHLYGCIHPHAPAPGAPFHPHAPVTHACRVPRSGRRLLCCFLKGSPRRARTVNATTAPHARTGAAQPRTPASLPLWLCLERAWSIQEHAAFLSLCAPHTFPSFRHARTQLASGGALADALLPPSLMQTAATRLTPHAFWPRHPRSCLGTGPPGPPIRSKGCGRGFPARGRPRKPFARASTRIWSAWAQRSPPSRSGPSDRRA